MISADDLLFPHVLEFAGLSTLFPGRQPVLALCRLDALSPLGGLGGIYQRGRSFDCNRIVTHKIEKPRNLHKRGNRADLQIIPQSWTSVV